MASAQLTKVNEPLEFKPSEFTPSKFYLVFQSVIEIYQMHKYAHTWSMYRQIWVQCHIVLKSLLVFEQNLFCIVV